MSKWSTVHYNALALEIRELFPTDPGHTAYERPQVTEIRRANMERRVVLTTLAICLAARFKADNPLFDPLKFLDACSPDSDIYPLSELWEGYQS